MTAREVAPEIRRFVLTSIPSVPFLEAMLLMREHGGHWDAARLARRLYVPESKGAELLRGLAAAGLARAEGEENAHVYAPGTAELGALVDGLARAYATNLVGITDLIHSRVDKRAQQFADAFRWRKDNGNPGG